MPGTQTLVPQRKHLQTFPAVEQAEFAGKTTLTDEEARAFAKKEFARLNRDNRDEEGTEADVDGGGIVETTATNQTSLIIDPPDGKLPPLTAAGKARAAARAAAGRRLGGPEDLSLGTRCILGFNAGPPWTPSFYTNDVQIFQTRDTVVLLNEMIHNARIVPLDGRPHGTVRQ